MPIVNNSTEWTAEEKALLYSDNLTDLDIMEKTGRSLSAIRKMRYKLTGAYVVRDTPFYMDGSVEVTREEFCKLLHIRRLAKDLGVKLYEDQCRCED